MAALAKEREKLSDNVLLKRLKAKDRKVTRTKKVVKFSAEHLPAATAAAIKTATSEQWQQKS